MVNTPVRIDIRYQSSPEDVALVDFDKLDIPKGDQPSKGYHFFSDLSPVRLPALKLRVVWDGGAEGTTISQRAASRILRAQGQLQPDEKVALVNPKRFKAQHFFGFADSGEDQKGVKVDVQLTLRMMAPCGSALPALEVRVVPGQLDDLLISAPDTGTGRRLVSCWLALALAFHGPMIGR